MVKKTHSQNFAKFAMTVNMVNMKCRNYQFNEAGANFFNFDARLGTRLKLGWAYRMIAYIWRY